MPVRRAAPRMRSQDATAFKFGADAAVRLDQRALAEVFASTNGPIAKAILKILAKAENAAKRKCPVDTGRLRASISTRLERDGASIAGIIGTNVEYAAPVEFGHRNVPPAAFLRGGLDEALRSQGSGGIQIGGAE